MYHYLNQQNNKEVPHMEIVQPIRDINQIRKIESILQSQSPRDYLLFVLGINSGLRISDILKLKAGDLRNQTHFIIRMQKTGKPLKIKIQPTLLKEINNYIKDKSDDEFLFKSQKGDNQPIQRIHAWRILNNAANKVGIKGEIGTHSLRKTFGYFMYEYCGKDITIVQKLLGHTSPQHTLRYIGILQDDLDEIIDNFDYNKIESKSSWSMLS